MLGIHEQFNHSALAKSALHTLNTPLSFSAPSYQHSGSSVMTQINEMTKRVTRSYFRRRSELLCQIFRPILLAIFLATLLPRLGNDQVGASLRVILIFFSISFGSLVGYSLMPTFVADRGVFYRERDSGTYGTFAYFTAHSFCCSVLNNLIMLACVFPLFYISGCA